MQAGWRGGAPGPFCPPVPATKVHLYFTASGVVMKEGDQVPPQLEHFGDLSELGGSGLRRWEESRS